MARVCVLLAQGFEEIEAATVIDVLRRAEIETVTLSVGVSGLEVVGAHGIAIKADKSIGDGASETWDMVVLPGGMPGATNLRDDPAAQSLIREQHAAGRRLGAICAAPIALAAAGVLQGKRATSYPGFESQLGGATYLTKPVIKDGTVVTSRGPGTAFAFALEIVSELQGRAVAEKLRSAMLIGV